MDFKCFKCEKKFNDGQQALSHLRKDHKIKENTEKMRCLRNNNCTKTYLTYSGLRIHIQSCVKIINNENEVFIFFSYVFAV